MSDLNPKPGFYDNMNDTVYVTPLGKVWLVASDDDLPKVREVGEMIEDATPCGELLTPDEAVAYLRQVEAEGGETLISE